MFSQVPPVLALTASADLESQQRVLKILNMEGAFQVTVSPSRDNIRLGLIDVRSTNLKCFDWLVKEILDKGQSMSPVLIYCHNYNVVGKVYGHLKKSLVNGPGLEGNRDMITYLLVCTTAVPLKKTRREWCPLLMGKVTAVWLLLPLPLVWGSTSQTFPVSLCMVHRRIQKLSFSRLAGLVDVAHRHMLCFITQPSITSLFTNLFER